ncbi:MAG: carboxypeptidase M32 [Candidatus Izimaplasma sp.]|nr:carboxypeptidase M32 [Candidatus Izimaplasma bacterium]
MKEEKRFREMIKKMKAYRYALSLIGWDSNTEAPRNAFKRRSTMTAYLSKELFLMQTAKDYQEVVNILYEKYEDLDDLLQREIKKAKRDLDKVINIPENEYVEYTKLINDTQIVWEDAKANNDFASFKENLEKIVEYNKKFALYYDKLANPYDTLLEDYEEGMATKEYDFFFDSLKKELVPFVKEILKKTNDKYEELNKTSFPKRGQKEFSEYLLEVFSFNKKSGLIKESVHPFTWNTSPEDVRFTTKYMENYIFSSIYSTIHELGHATYEQQISTSYDDTLLNGGTSMGIHESQSRFYENNIGRSLAFWETHFDKFKEIFPEQVKGYNPIDMYKACNRVQTSLIRIEADELTYSMHIMIRYDIERMLFSNEIEVKDLPKVWNDKMEEYLGVRPTNDTEGVLQDVHWSVGMFGYFPTYALGSAYSAQIYYAMKKELNIDNLIRENKIKVINEWLKDKLHKYGSSKTPKELMEMITKEKFNPKYYIKYLKEKYSNIYN